MPSQEGASDGELQRGHWSVVFLAVAAGIAIVALSGWLLNLPLLASYGASLATMKANTAVGFILTAAAAWLVQSARTDGWRRTAASVLAILVVLLALSTIAEYLLEQDWGIDEILLRDTTAEPGTYASGRMGANTALGLGFCNAAILLFATRWRRSAVLGQLCAVVVACIALVAVLGYVHSVSSLYAVRSYTQMSVPSTIAFLLLAAGLLAIYPTLGPMSSVTSPYAGGIMMRRLLPATLTIPFGFAWLVQQGERVGLYPSGLTLPIVVALTIASLTVVLYISATTVNSADASQRALAEQLSESEARFRGLFDHVAEGVFQTTPDGRLLLVNPAFVDMLGYDSAEELLRHQTPDLYETDEQRRTVVSDLQRDGQIRNTEVQLKRRDGTSFPALVNIRVVEYDGGDYYEGTVTDVTERARLEARLRQAQKMEAVGQLAGGVAHDFNNILTAILGYAEVLLDEYEEGDRLRRDVEEIKKAGNRAAGLTRQLLAFSRQQVLLPTVVDLNALTDNLASMLRRLIGGHIQLSLDLDADLGAVRADPGQIEQVIMNLVVNARDAMPRGGQLTIETANVDLDEEYSRSHGIVMSDYGRFAMLAVSDTGIGMSEETKRKIFEPFFTTKPRHQGTGLGLATVYGIVKQSRGYVWVYSEPGQGTTVKVYLPEVDAPLALIRHETEEKEAVEGGSETILLVDDEESIRLLSRTFLERHGYRVLDAANAVEAFETLSKHPEPVNLLLTDVIMPGESGPELLRRVRVIRPDICVLYVSGYADQAIFNREILETGAPFLQKPFSRPALARKVRDVLDARLGA